MTTLHRLESDTNDPDVGGLLVTFDSGVSKTLAWRSAEQVDVTQTARRCTEGLLEALQRASTPEADAALRDTNWVSLCAAVCRHVDGWNAARAG